jgi:hypothetical protein
VPAHHAGERLGVPVEDPRDRVLIRGRGEVERPGGRAVRSRGGMYEPGDRDGLLPGSDEPGDERLPRQRRTPTPAKKVCVTKSPAALSTSRSS